jgi:hypothetical protein
MSRPITTRGAYPVNYEGRKERKKDKETARCHPNSYSARVIREANQDVERAERCG